jgi:hypothetical protein
VRLAPRPLFVARRAIHVGGPSRTRPWPPAPAGGACTAAPAGGACGGEPVDTLAGAGAPAPTPRASLAGMMPSEALARAIMLREACALKAYLKEFGIAIVRTSYLITLVHPLDRRNLWQSKPYIRLSRNIMANAATCIGGVSQEREDPA